MVNNCHICFIDTLKTWLQISNHTNYLQSIQDKNFQNHSCCSCIRCRSSLSLFNDACCEMIVYCIYHNPSRAIFLRRSQFCFHPTYKKRIVLESYTGHPNKKEAVACCFSSATASFFGGTPCICFCYFSQIKIFG